MNLINQMNQINPTNTMNKNNICNNCGKQGHLFHQCKLPITSYGIILFRTNDKGIQYLMIRRKDSFGYIDFLRGKYIQHNVEHLRIIFNEMSVPEKEMIKTNHFGTLWKQMWGDTHIGSQYKSEEMLSQKKFDALKTGIVIKCNNEDADSNHFLHHCTEVSELITQRCSDSDTVTQKNEIVSLETLITNSTTAWKETEWEFPKGRRNYQEKDLDCALREFEEETGLSKKQIQVVENLMPFEEIFIGSNHKSYKHKYFLACATNININVNVNNNNSLHNFQKTEVSKIEWKTLEECLESIRPYNLEKKQLIININKVLQEYSLY
jgi:8-oxo-dGTP pyrophosphatase MutT (NUDIX family)